MLVVNLFGAPSCGKSTLALLIGGVLKTEHPYLASEVPNEVPKFLAYDGRKGEVPRNLRCQPFVMGQQLWQIARCEGHADVVITDSPVLLSAVYGKEYGQDIPDSFLDVCRHYHYAYKSMNYYVVRQHAYEEKARVTSEKDAARIDSHIKMVLSACDVTYETVKSSMDDAHRIVAQIVQQIEKSKCPN